MRIGIDARLYKKGLGLGRYLEKLLENISQLESEHEFVLFLNKDAFLSYTPTRKNIRTVCVDIPWYSLREQLYLPFVLLREKCDLVHFPHFNVPLVYPKKFIITIHDCILLKHAQSATSFASTKHPLIHWLKYTAYRFVLTSATYRAKKVIAVTYGVKKDLMELVHVPEKKICVVYEGVDVGVRKTRIKLPPCIQKPYVVYVGNAFPHKNCEGLLDTFELVKKESLNLSLVMCGQEDFFYQRICSEIKKRNLSDHVFHLGNVSDELLESLYCDAVACITVSLEEGFGLPSLEAMACTTPVIASCCSVIPEVLGSAALYVDPTDSQDIFRALKDIMYNEELRKELSRRGLERVARYQWSRMARDILDMYNDILV